jgi:DNA (cytosine-5)-methyltransferase 3A
MGIIVLSLFDGISCGQVALERAGISVDKYYASEIDKYAIQVTQKNYPNTIQLGDVTKIDFKQIEGKIDLLIGGSPCQDLSNYKYDRGGVTGLEGSKSSLFWHYVKALKTLKPKYFLLENVASMENKWIDIISEELGVQPIEINSALVCAAERKRLYWTNIGQIGQPENKEVLLKDILECDVPDKYYYGSKYPITLHGLDKKVCATIHLNGHRQTKEVYSPNFKCNTILCDGNGGNRVKKVLDKKGVRKLTPLEYERLQTLPDNYTLGLSDSRRYTAIGNGWTVDVIAYILNNIKECKHGEV